MALVDDEQVVLGEVVEQRVGRLPRGPAVQVARVVLDAGAEAHLGEQLEIVARALLQALRLEQLVLALEHREPLGQLGADRLDRALHDLLARHVVARGVDRHALESAQHGAAEGIDLGEGLHHVAEELDADRPRLLVGGEDLHHVAPHPEGAAVEVVVAALVLHVDQLAQHDVALDPGLAVEEDEHVEVARRRAQAVDAGHARHHDDVVALEQRLGGGVAHLVDLVVDGGVLLDVGVGRGDVGLGLVVVVVADEVAHGVVGEERAELVVELRRQRLVGRDHEGGPVQVGDHVRDGEGLAAPGDAEQDLVRRPRAHALGEGGDRLRLIALGGEVGAQLEGALAAHAAGDHSSARRRLNVALAPPVWLQEAPQPNRGGHACGR